LLRFFTFLTLFILIWTFSTWAYLCVACCSEAYYR